MDSIMKKTAFIIGLISLLTACNSGSDDRFMELPDTPAGKASISFDGARTRASLNTVSSTFALYGTATDADSTSVVFNNQKIEYNNESTLWVYSPLNGIHKPITSSELMLLIIPPGISHSIRKDFR